MRLFSITAALIALAAPLHAATVTEKAASVTLWDGDILAEARR